MPGIGVARYRYRLTIGWHRPKLLRYSPTRTASCWHWIPPSRGRLDNDGYLTIMDRKKDMIIIGGENVYSPEVEAALFEHAAVVEAALIGIPDSRYGETVCAVIVARDGSATSEQTLIAHRREPIGGYKIPRRVEFVSQMPKSAMGKILKTELRSMFAQKVAC